VRSGSLLYLCEDKRDYFILEKEMLNGEG
jgi:hypothetical protein